MHNTDDMDWTDSRDDLEPGDWEDLFSSDTVENLAYPDEEIENAHVTRGERGKQSQRRPGLAQVASLLVKLHVEKLDKEWQTLVAANQRINDERYALAEIDALVSFEARYAELEDALLDGDEERAIAILRKGLDLQGAGGPLVLRAAYHGRGELCEALVAQGADVLYLDPHDIEESERCGTPLYSAKLRAKISKDPKTIAVINVAWIEQKWQRMKQSPLDYDDDHMQWFFCEAATWGCTTVCLELVARGMVLNREWDI